MSERPPQTSTEILEKVARYYADRFAQFGATARGVDWNSTESQTLRFSRLLTVIDRGGELSLNDYGCGYGALLTYLRSTGCGVAYQGFDINAETIAAARTLHAGDGNCSFTSDPSAVRLASFSVASGVFNVRLGFEDAAWRAYVHETIARLALVSEHGFAFNMLSTYSDPQKRRSDLYYMDPLVMFDYCKQRFSPKVALLHDYPLYEFTIVVRT